MSLLRAAIENESSTLGKSKEEHSEFYPSYPRSPDLDIK